MKIAIVPGSYDPMTMGHVDIVERAAALFDKVYVAVMMNSEKTYTFSLDKRTQIARLSCAHIANAEVVASGGLLVDLFDMLKADVIVKGVRNETDFTYEQSMAYYNWEHNPRAQTIYLPCRQELSEISSTKVRDLLLSGESAEGLLAPSAQSYIRAYFESKK